ncbi:MAG: DUF1993 domain-containing protein [Pontixanthobacter sp.]
MLLTLHAAIVPPRLQTITAIRKLVDTAEEWCTTNVEAPHAILKATLADDMWAFPWQIHSVWMHSAHALAATKEGVFEPKFENIPDSFAECRDKLDDARDFCLACDADTLNARSDDNLDFLLGGKVRMSFTVQNFLLTFSNPNFYFHAATAYDILRMKGLDIGKRDFLGAPQIKG